MTFKSDTQPFCRYCGKPIAKRVDTVYFGRKLHGRPEFPKTTAEARRLVNGTVVSCRWQRYVSNDDPDRIPVYRTDGEPDHDYVAWVGVWDGESYEDEFFCTQVDARRFAYLYARGGHATTDYNRAALKASLKSD